MWLDGQRLRMVEGENEQEHILALERGELMLQWNLFRPDVGNAVEITSGARPCLLLRCPGTALAARMLPLHLTGCPECPNALVTSLYRGACAAPALEPQIV